MAVCVAVTGLGLSAALTDASAANRQYQFGPAVRVGQFTSAGCFGGTGASAGRRLVVDGSTVIAGSSANDPTSGAQVVAVARSADGGAHFGAAETVAPPDGSHNECGIVLARHAGTTYAAWDQLATNSASTNGIGYAVKADGASSWTVGTLTNDGTQSISVPSIAVDSSGDVFVAYSSFSAGTFTSHLLEPSVTSNPPDLTLGHGAGPAVAVSPTGTLVVVDGSGTSYTFPSGLGSPVPHAGVVANGFDLSISFDAAGRLYLAEVAIDQSTTPASRVLKVYSSTDGGASFTPLDPNGGSTYTFGTAPRGVSISGGPPGVAYLATSTCQATLSYTTDAGATWTPATVQGAAVFLPAGTADTYCQDYPDVTTGSSGTQLLMSYANAQPGQPTTVDVTCGDRGATCAPPGPPQLTYFAGNGVRQPAQPGAQAASTGVGLPQAIVTDRAGDTFIADEIDAYVYEVSPAGVITIYAGNGSSAKETAGPATKSGLGEPASLALDAAGDLFIGDLFNQVVAEVTPAGQLSVVAGGGNGNPSATPQPATSVALGQVQAVATDPSGNLYVEGSSATRLQVFRVDPSGNLTVFAGNGSVGNPVAGPATSSPLNGGSLATDGAGDVYLTDTGGYVAEVTPSGQLSIIAGNGGTGAPASDGQPAKTVPVGLPGGIGVGPAGDVYFTDVRNKFLYDIAPNGTLHRVAGISGSTAKATAGPASQSSIGTPYSLAVDDANDVFVGDIANYYVYRIAPSTQSATPPPTTAPPTTAPPTTAPPTTAPPTTSTTTSTTTPPRPAQPVGEGGYRTVSADGGVLGFGDAPVAGSAAGVPLRRPVVGSASSPGGGYWLVSSDGGVFTYGGAGFFGSLGGLQLSAPIVGIAPTPSGGGYWLVGADGGVFSFGDASFAGSTGNLRLQRPVVGMAATPSGKGYWLAAADGGVFSFGDATFAGAATPLHPVAPVVGMAAPPSGGGYWLVDGSGGVFSFGAAHFAGSAGALRLSAPVVGMATTPDGGGYLLAGADGGVFAFGDASFLGARPSASGARTVALTATR